MGHDSDEGARKITTAALPPVCDEGFRGAECVMGLFWFADAHMQWVMRL